MKTIITFITIFLATITNNISAQTISFGYDAAGNRISRTIVIQQQAAKVKAAPTEEPEVYTEILSDLLIKIYPNPTDGILKVEIENLPEGQEAILSLHNMQGKQILKQQTASGSEELNITNQPAGTYILRIVAGNNKTEWKIIKK